MRKSTGGSFFWPEKQDRAVTEINQLVSRLSQPDMDRRDRLDFKSDELTPYKLIPG